MTLLRSTLLVGILGVGSLLRATGSQRMVKVEKIDGYMPAANPTAGLVCARSEAPQ